MRLTHLKLAGFKSFVDPTTLHIHGQRVGVVGPNGCGKSNVMESVRWVLGESSAKEMRGDSMDAVIFNGSGNRKPISRASVELVFDNSLGGASGEWSQYAEISVKRIIERDKGSSYYINNTLVRRRDVADLFLGTGLGSRAYAIIGQNTISRIIEAKPEELRIFLEEAAGISKYKERRRETELRLRDTRDNLSRVEDIRQEIDKQIVRLDAQAVIAEQYHQLQDALKLAQGQLWLIKKRDASVAWDKTKRGVEKLVNDLEAQMAALRSAEANLERLRQAHFASTEQVQNAQAQYYQANAEVSNLEQQVKHTTDARERLLQQLQQLDQQQERNISQAVSLQDEMQRAMAQQAEAIIASEHANIRLEAAKQSMPEAEQNYRLSQQAYAKAQQALSQSEQGIRVETNSVSHLSQNLQELSNRLQRLEQERLGLKLPEQTSLVQKQQLLAELQENNNQISRSLESLRQQEQTRVEQVKVFREAQTQHERQLSQVEAQIFSLNKLQQALGQSSKLDAWLSAEKLDGKSRLWQKVGVENGWGIALEAILGERLNAVIAELVNVSATRPPALVALCEITTRKPVQTQPAESLMAKLNTTAPELQAVLEDWLSGVYVADNAEVALQKRLQLKAGEAIVTPEGDIYTQYSVVMYAANSQLHGILDRQRELATLDAQLPDLKRALIAQQQATQAAENSILELKAQIQAQQQQLTQQTQQQHRLSLEIQSLEQQRQHVIDRQLAIQKEQALMRERSQQLEHEKNQKQTDINHLNTSLESVKQSLQTLHETRQGAEKTLNEARNSLQSADRYAQEMQFNLKLISNNINELNNKINVNSEEKSALSIRKAEHEEMLAAAKMEGLKANLENALNHKQSMEAALVKAREAMSEAEQQLQQEERNRMQAEQVMHPLRDKLEQARLAEQQARLHFEQCSQSLVATGLFKDANDEAKLLESIGAIGKALEYEQKVATIQQNVEALGAVNLAAIQELAAERERKQYLDSQALDLEQAIATLDEAIRKIDKETRSRLQQTFDETNLHFGELFSVLFGGGQARLELLGDEILDNGMQVFAQPPGKKNSTIHLLSGGEKALTALALVFALFRLNPAPFCLMDEVDAPLDDSNTERFCSMVRKMSEKTQFLFVSHNKITMEMAQQLIGVTMQESGVSRIVEVDIEAALRMQDVAVA